MTDNRTLRHAVALFAHPDDETVLIGGVLAMLAANGVDVHIISATRGEGGEMGEPPAVNDRAELGPLRERELQAAGAALGAASVVCMDYIDPTVGEDDTLHPFEHDFPTLVSDIAALLVEKEADLVLTHGRDGEYGHPAHQLVYRAVSSAVSSLRAGQMPDLLLYTVAAQMPGMDDHLLNQNVPAHIAIDITPYAEQKVAAMEAHVSQAALFKRRRKLKTVREALRSLESVRRVQPPDGAVPDDEFARMLLAAGGTVVDWENA